MDFPFDETMQAVGRAVVSVILGLGETNLFWYSAIDGSTQHMHKSTFFPFSTGHIGRGMFFTSGTMNVLKGGE
jgi:hypothetical protein